MITIYSSKGIEYQPRETIGKSIEDCHERQFAIDLIQGQVSEVLGLLKEPIKLFAFLSIFWPVILYG